MIVPPEMRDLAQCLLTYEAVAGKTSEPTELAASRVLERLRRPVVTLMGVAGFRSLLSRSLALASGDVPWLRALHVRADGSLEGFKEIEGKLSAEEIGLGEVALAVRFIGLLVVFIGPTLTLQLLHDTWPKMEELAF